MPVHDDLGTRMKEFYEGVPKTRLMRRTPVAIRIDGKAFHTFTRGFKRPFDEILIKSMQETTQYLCEHIQGCVLGYTQSDEITLLLTDYDTLTTDAWFDNNVQKICSVSASMATMIFNDVFSEQYHNRMFEEEDPTANPYFNTLFTKLNRAMFDSRCFNIPEDEVTNCFIWRQQDATRNAIQMLGQCNFSHKELHGKSCSAIQDMLMDQKGINFNDMPTEFKRGVCCRRDEDGKWVLDKEIPIFTQDRDYVDKTFKVKEV